MTIEDWRVYYRIEVMKEYLKLFAVSYGIGFGLIMLLTIMLAYENLQKIKIEHIVVVLAGTFISTAILTKLSMKE